MNLAHDLKLLECASSKNCLGQHPKKKTLVTIELFMDGWMDK